MQSRSRLDHGNCVEQPASPLAGNPKKHSGIAGIVKLLLVLGACFTIGLPRGDSLVNPHVALEKIDRLNKDLTALKILKKKYADDEMELRRDKQRIDELERQRQDLRRGFEKTAQFFLEQKAILEDGNRRLEDAILDAASFNTEQRAERAKAMSALSEDVSRAVGELTAEHDENMALRRILYNMREEIDKRKGLRGQSYSKKELKSASGK